MKFRLSALAAACLLWGTASAQDIGFANVGMISATMGVNDGRICTGEFSRGDIGCASNAPYISRTTGFLGIGLDNPVAELHVSGTGIARLSGDTPRLTLAPVYNSTTNLWNIDNHNGTIRLFVEDYSPDGRGVNGMVRLSISPEGQIAIGPNVNYTDNPSSTLQVAGNIQLGLEISSTLNTCDADRAGAMRWNGSQFQVCYGSGGWALLSSALTSGTETLGDRITSGTTEVVVNSSTSYVSLSTSGSNWGYLSSAGSYLPRISTVFASATTISASYIQIPSATTALACTSGVAGTMRYTSGTMQICNGTAWGNVGLGLPTGTISAFATSSCPAGWTEYTPARGRFLRGIDNGAGLDPDGTRAAGSAQTDLIKDHAHYLRSMINGDYANYSDGGSLGGWGIGGAAANNQGVARLIAGNEANTAQNIGTGAETRPVNVAVTFCMYSGYGSEVASGITTLDGLADVDTTGASVGNVLAFDGASWVPSSTTSSGGALGDRITSGTSAVTVQSGGVISITTNGTTANYFNTAGKFITSGIGAGIATPSTTLDVSGTARFRTAANNNSCTVDQDGALRYNSTTGRLQICRQE